jgi:hypothetical protein
MSGWDATMSLSGQLQLSAASSAALLAAVYAPLRRWWRWKRDGEGLILEQVCSEYWPGSLLFIFLVVLDVVCVSCSNDNCYLCFSCSFGCVLPVQPPVPQKLWPLSLCDQPCFARPV